MQVLTKINNCNIQQVQKNKNLSAPSNNIVFIPNVVLIKVISFFSQSYMI